MCYNNFKRYNFEEESMKIISKRVLLLSFISLFTDIASEMLYPITPIYLKSIGYSIVIIGILEGFAEAVAGLSKGYFGALSDLKGKRTPFVKIGYLFSAFSKPLLVLSQLPLWIFFTRTIDRLGKGIRTGARDAILAEEATKETKASVFGFHRAMDTTGAIIGPLVALIFLYFYPNKYKTLFLLAFIPGIIAVSISLFLKEKNKESSIVKKKTVSFFSFLSYLKESNRDYKKLIIGLLFFTILNSSDVFLLLKMKQVGISDTGTIGVYIFYNLVYALFAFPLGILADKIGLKKIFIFGLLLFSFVYLGMAKTNSLIICFILFFIYGIYAAATESIGKAWISHLVPKEQTASAIGTFSSFQSLGTMIASSLAGLIWYKFGANVMFMFSGIGVLFVSLYFGFYVSKI